MVVDGQGLRSVPGKTCYLRQDRGADATGTYWYRYDDAYVGERKLEGIVHVRLVRHTILGRDTGRTQKRVQTFFRGKVVPGEDLRWLLKQNIEAGNVPAEELVTT